MPKYIELEAAKNILRQHQHRFTCADEANGYGSVKWSEEVIYAETAQNALDALPAADVRPVVRGEWYGSGDGYADGHLVIDEWECPCCGKYFDEWDERPTWNFCPNCGADMRAEGRA